MVDLSESFDTSTLTEQDLWQSELNLKTSGRNKYLFGWPFTSSSNRSTPYSLLRNENKDIGFSEKNYATLSDTSLVRGIRLKRSHIPDFKYPKFIPIYDANKTAFCKKISFNASHPVPWFDIEASCLKMKNNDTIADLSRYLAEGKLYAVNDVPNKDIKKLESMSNTSVNLDEAYSNEDMMGMYRMMHEVRREREKVRKSKSHKLKSSGSTSSLSLSDLSLDSTFDDQGFQMKEKTKYTTIEKGEKEHDTEFKWGPVESFGITSYSSTESDSRESSDDPVIPFQKFAINANNLSDINDKETPMKMSKPSPSRFGESNERHCEAVANLVKKRLFSNRNKTNNDEPVVDLYVELVDGRIRPLCHIKTGMANLCLNTFFFPCTNIASVTWVNNIQEKVLRKIFKKFDPLKDIFGKHISRLDMSDVKAVLFLSKSAKDIVKHKDLCMIETLTVTLGIQGSILLLNMEQKPEELL